MNGKKLNSKVVLKVILCPRSYHYCTVFLKGHEFLLFYFVFCFCPLLTFLGFSLFPSHFLFPAPQFLSAAYFFFPAAHFFPLLHGRYLVCDHYGVSYNCSPTYPYIAQCSNT